MARYQCGKCKFGFSRTGEVECCPKCGSMSVSYANSDEKQRYGRPKVTVYASKPTLLKSM